MTLSETQNLAAHLSDIDKALPSGPWTNKPFVTLNGRQVGCNACITDGGADAWAPFARLGNGHPKFDERSVATADNIIALRNALPLVIRALQGSFTREYVAEKAARALAAFQIDAVKRHLRLPEDVLAQMIEQDHTGWLAEGAAVADALFAEADVATTECARRDRPDDETLDPHLPESIRGEKRCGIQRAEWMTGWFVPWSPRNDNQNAEGPWSHWVSLANAILAADAKAIAALQSATGQAQGAEA